MQELVWFFIYEKWTGQALLLLFPFFILIELPMNLLVVAGILRWYSKKLRRTPFNSRYTPKVSCIITCYSEGRDVLQTLQTLCEQTYPGHIELIPVVDGASQNQDTLNVIRDFKLDRSLYPNRTLKAIPKWQRGGRVSSLNAGLQAASGEIVLALDGDTSFDNNTVSVLVRHFEDPNVPAVSGSLRVRNAKTSLVTRIQELEYFLSIHTSKVGLSEWNTVNNISGAFGAFRKNFLQHIGGWDTHSAEDLDITLRIKSYFGRQPYRIPFEPEAIGHTDAPITLREFLMQRLRWDGDLFFLYIRKHSHSITPRLLGWPNFLMTLFTGFFFQLVLPFMIVIYSVAMLILIPIPMVIVLTVFVYVLYLIMTIIIYLIGLMLVSERRRQDLRMLAVVPIFPLFMFALRCWGVVCILNEVFRRGHEESGMAPWWVLKKGKRF
ncbi:glycosyltransferase [Pseudomonas sp. C27(2019)]|nr:glycosyltransferase [Pseudomonas sp. C27(2019)]